MLKRMMAGTLAGLALFLVGATVVTAESHPERVHDETRERVVGVVQSEQGQTFEVKTRSGEIVIVHWTPDTSCSLNGEPSPCEAIGPGHLLGAAGSYAGGSNQFQADVIKARVRPQIDHVAGIVERDGDHELLVNTRDGARVLVLWSDDTTCRTRESVVFDCDRIELPDRIVAAGQLDGGSLKARMIVKLADFVRPEITRVHGIVSSAQGRVIMIETRDGGTVNVHWDAETVCSNGDGEIACDTIHADMGLLAAGEDLGDHNLAAKRIVVRVLDTRPLDVRPHDVRPADERRSDVRPLDARALDAQPIG